MPKKIQVRITQSAERDLEEIRSYIHADSSARAEAFLIEWENQVPSLESLPLRYPAIPENDLLGVEYRHLPYGKYRTLFRIAGKAVFILRVIHGARLLESSMFETDL